MIEQVLLVIIKANLIFKDKVKILKNTYNLKLNSIEKY